MGGPRARGRGRGPRRPPSGRPLAPPHPSDRETAAACAFARAAASHLLTAVDVDVAAAFERERAVNRELGALKAAAARASSAAAAWAAALAPVDAALRDLGDSASFLGAAADEVEAVAALLERLAGARAAARGGAAPAHPPASA